MFYVLNVPMTGCVVTECLIKIENVITLSKYSYHSCEWQDTARSPDGPLIQTNLPISCVFWSIFPPSVQSVGSGKAPSLFFSLVLLCLG